MQFNFKRIVLVIVISFSYIILEAKGEISSNSFSYNHHPEKVSHPVDHNVPKEARKNAILKGCSALIMFCFSILFGVFPKILVLIPKIWISLVNIFGSGAMVSSFAVYILPEVSEHANHDEYPISFLAIVMIYAFLLFLDKVLLNIPHKHINEYHTDHEEECIEKNEEVGLITVDNDKKSLVTVILLTLMISFHSIIESILIGIQTEVAGTLAITLTIISHKWVESLSLGILMIKKRINGWRFFLILTLFSLTSPLGIGIGTFIRGYLSSLWNSIFNAMVAGTFLYIGVNEIINEEFGIKESKQKRLLRFLFLLLGISVVSVIRIWLKHDR